MRRRVKPNVAQAAIVIASLLLPLYAQGDTLADRALKRYEERQTGASDNFDDSTLLSEPADFQMQTWHYLVGGGIALLVIWRLFFYTAPFTGTLVVKPGSTRDPYA